MQFKSRWYNKGEKNTFLTLEKRPFNQKNFVTLNVFFTTVCLPAHTQQTQKLSDLN